MRLLQDVVQGLEESSEWATTAAKGDDNSMTALNQNSEYKYWQWKRRKADLASLNGDLDDVSDAPVAEGDIERSATAPALGAVGRASSANAMRVGAETAGGQSMNPVTGDEQEDARLYMQFVNKVVAPMNVLHHDTVVCR